MVLGALSGLGLLEIVLFLLPGLAGIKAALWKAHRADWLNQIDTVAASFCLSLFSMSVIYVVHSGNIGSCAIALGRACDPFLTEAEITEMIEPLQSLLTLYSQLYAGSIGSGLLVGSVYYHGFRAGETIPRGELWPHYFSLVRNSESSSLAQRVKRSVANWSWYKRISSVAPNNGHEEHYIRVHTIDGVVIDGKMTQEGEPSQNRDIILEKPKIISFGEDGSETVQDEWTGSVYIHDQGISHIQFDDLSTADEIVAKQERKNGSTESAGSEDWEAMEKLGEAPDEGETGEDQQPEEDEDGRNAGQNGE